MGRHQRPGSSRVRSAVAGNLAEFARAITAVLVTGAIAAVISFVAVRLTESGERDAAVITAVLELVILVDLLIEWGVQSVRATRQRAEQDTRSRRPIRVEVSET